MSVLALCFGRLCILAVSLGASLVTAAQVPLHAASSPPATAYADKWRFDRPPVNSTSNFIFDGVSSLLQQWANTHYRNGHNIVPATIPTGTLLYHGTWHKEVPSTPEWVATDPEHSMLFCREMGKDQGCWHLTLAATRPLNVLYFDGSSAAKMHGTMDSQDIIIWPDVRDDRTWLDSSRIIKLCDWGKRYKLDGYMRMEPDFEIMLCDFTNGVEVVSFANLVPAFRWRPDGPGRRPPKGPSSPGFQLGAYRTLEAGKWHDRFPGETRAQLDLCRLISFYDSNLFPDVHLRQIQQERWEHRVGNLTETERERFHRRLDEALTTGPSGSGVDWSSVYRVVIHRYSERLEILQYMLNNTAEESLYSPEETLNNTHRYVKSMLGPYLLNSARPDTSTTPSSAGPFSWASPVFELCATSHTKVISKALLTYSEIVLLNAVNDVLHEICRVTVGIWAEGIELGVGDNGDLLMEPTADSRPATEVILDWKDRITSLMEWLDWSVWVKCRPECSFEESCYIPTWPWLRWGMLPLPPGGPPGPKNPPSRDNALWHILNESQLSAASSFQRNGTHSQEDDDTYWQRPSPRCLRRVFPLEDPS